MAVKDAPSLSKRDLRERSQNNFSQYAVDKIFNQFYQYKQVKDPNIDLHEFICYMVLAANVKFSEKINLLFCLFDKDGDVTLDKEETVFFISKVIQSAAILQ